MKILVTGGLGFIGHNVVSLLEKENHEVIIIDSCTTYNVIPEQQLNYLITERKKKFSTNNIYYCDILDQVEVSKIIEQHRPDIIIHLAGYPRQKVVKTNPQHASRTMIEGLLNLLETYSNCNQVKRFVYVSSSMVYGDFVDGVKETTFCNPVGQYGILKLAGEQLVKDYARRGLFDYVIIRPTAVYGALDTEDRVVAKFIYSAIRGEALKVNGFSESLDFTDVRDTANGIVKAALSNDSANKTYNISRGKSRTLLDAASVVTNIVGKGLIKLADRDYSFPSRSALSITSARKDFNYDPKINIEEGFQAYYNWIISSNLYQ